MMHEKNRKNCKKMQNKKKLCYIPLTINFKQLKDNCQLSRKLPKISIAILNKKRNINQLGKNLSTIEWQVNKWVKS